MTIRYILIVSSILATVNGLHGDSILSQDIVETDCRVLQTQNTMLWVGRADRCVFLEDESCSARKQSVVSKRRIDECLVDKRKGCDRFVSLNVLIEAMGVIDRTDLYFNEREKAKARYLYGDQSCAGLIRLYWRIYDPMERIGSIDLLLVRNGVTARLLKQYLMGKPIEDDEIYEIVFVNYYLNSDDSIAEKMYLFLLWWFVKTGTDIVDIDTDTVRGICDPFLQENYERLWSMESAEALQGIAGSASVFDDIACPTCWELRTQNAVIALTIKRLETQLANGNMVSKRETQLQADDARWLLNRVP